MVTELAILNVKKGEELSFEKDFKVAGKYIRSIQGYLGHTLKKCIEAPSRYILIAYWDNLEDHEVGFRKSEQYLKWKELLHHYYDPFPTVEHYQDIVELNFISE